MLSLLTVAVAVSMLKNKKRKLRAKEKKEGGRGSTSGPAKPTRKTSYEKEAALSPLFGVFSVMPPICYARRR